MSPRPSITTNVSPYLSARGGRADCVAVIVKEASEAVSAENVGAAISAAICVAVLGGIAFRLTAATIGIVAHGLAPPRIISTTRVLIGSATASSHSTMAYLRNQIRPLMQCSI
jgi:hypothetical protein